MAVAAGRAAELACRVPGRSNVFLSRPGTGGQLARSAEELRLMGLGLSWSPLDGEPAVPELLSMRTLDPDHAFEAPSPIPQVRPRYGIEATILEGLMKAYPLAPVVEEVDDRFLRLLDAIADLDLGPSRRA